MILCNTTDCTNISTERVQISMNDVTEECFLTYENGKVIKTTDSSKENIFLKDLQGEDSEVYRLAKIHNLLNKKVKLTYDMVKDINENPLLIVVCNTIEFYSGVETDLRIFVDEDKMYVMLVSGVCCIDGAELSRCSKADITGRTKITYQAEDMKLLLSKVFKDFKAGYDYSNDIIANIVIEHEDSVNFKAGKTSQNTYFFNQDKLLNAQNKFKNKMLEQQLKDEARREELRLATERLREEKNKKEEADRLRKLEEIENNKQKEKKRKEIYEEVNIGAKDFLKIISELS